MTATDRSPSRRGGKAARLVERLGGRFSVAMGIDLGSLDKRELFKWFIAAVLFGAPIPQGIAARTYAELSDDALLSPQALLRRGWDGLVEVLDRGGYVRYDFKTATKLLELSKALLDGYQGDLNNLREAASDPRDLERRLEGLAKGIGDVTVGIFLRELRGLWPKAQPRLSSLVMVAARDLGLISRRSADAGGALQRLQKLWVDEGHRGKDFPDFEAALVRYGLELRRKPDRIETLGARRRLKH